MNSLLPIAVLADPGPWAQWAGILVTCVGMGFSLWAALAARSAKVAAEQAAKHVGLLGTLAKIEEVRYDMIRLEQAVSARDATAVAERANRLRLIVARLPRSASSDSRAFKQAEILLALTKLGTVAAGCGKQPTIKQTTQLRIAVGELQELIGRAAGSIEDALRSNP